MSSEIVEVDAALFRSVLGRFPTGVTVVSAIDGDHPVGLAAGSFFSVSLDPPLVGFCVMKGSSTWSAIERTGRFGVSVLADDQVEVSRALGGRGPDKFADVEWAPAPVTGSPFLAGAVAHIDCTTEAVYPGGDHWIVVGRVRHLAHGPEGRGPLVFLAGTYGRNHPI